MSVIKASRVSLDSVPLMMNICASIIHRQVHRDRKVKKLSAPAFFRNISKVHSRHIGNSITAHYQTTSSSTEMELEIP